MTGTPRWVATARRPSRVLVVGGASLDVLHVRGVPTPSAGGAGLYAALAAARCGADVTMLAPVPSPMPDPLAPALERIRWIGPTVPPEGLPRFEIAYDEHGDVTLFREHLGAEPDMRPDLLALADSLPGGIPAVAYCVPFLDATLQRAFVRALRARECLVAANTYLHGVRQQPAVVRATFAEADVFFCNEAEAEVLFGRDAPRHTAAGRLLFVTRGARGALAVQGDLATEVPSPPAAVLDPTGAGDTFCGTVLALLARGASPVEAAAAGCREAADEVHGVGPARLWQPPSPPEVHLPVRVDHDRLDTVARLLATTPAVRAFDFLSDDLPAPGDPGALDWFCAATLQQYGFWYGDVDGWTGPMTATLGGVRRRGSDHLWAAYLRWSRADPTVTSPARQATLTEADLAAALSSDEGVQPHPMLADTVALARAYGRTMLEMGWTPASLVAAANATERPTAALLALLDHVGGYREDPLRKKAALLAVILRQRPEAWLRAVDGDDVPPIVDYHVQRTCLRTGVVTATDTRLRALLASRRWMSPDDEAAVRRACAEAVRLLVERSGRTMGEVDWFLFQMRHRCPELTVPDCAACPADPACAHRVVLFQPVFRTTAY
jgi:ribokinase